jgi:hypothetical protein
MDTEAIITGLILMDVAATLAGNFVIWQEISRLTRRQTIIETQHRINHPGQD